MTCYADFPDELQRLIDDLEQEGFDVVYGKVGGESGTPAFIAERGETFIQVEDWTQTWGFTLRDPDRPAYGDTWAYPYRVREEIWTWLDEFGD